MPSVAVRRNCTECGAVDGAVQVVLTEVGSEKTPFAGEFDATGLPVAGSICSHVYPSGCVGFVSGSVVAEPLSAITPGVLTVVAMTLAGTVLITGVGPAMFAFKPYDQLMVVVHPAGSVTARRRPHTFGFRSLGPSGGAVNVAFAGSSTSFVMVMPRHEPPGQPLAPLANRQPSASPRPPHG